MGQKTHPIGIRVGIIRGWESNWFEKRSYATKLKEDQDIRSYVKTRLRNAAVSRIVIDRTTKNVIVTIHTAKPGLVIGKSGQDIQKLEEELKTKFAKDVKVQVTEIKKPELDATIVAENIARQLEGRISFRRAMKTSLSSTIKAGGEGIKIMCAGRLGGAEMARTEQYKEGRTPLHTLRSDIDYANGRAETIYGSIGIKVWICRGEILGKRVSD
ncbi:MAG: 30S ribosomal protein S3 [Ignavibacteriaceae bacterium]|nr:MAG: 30S ribosomal protein S3 [Ignavibacteriaceae bacterium]